MSIHIIPVNRLSPVALQGVIEEYVTRDGTDYGDAEISLEQKIKYVRDRLKDGSAVLIFDDKTETTNILLANDPVLQNRNT
ncbi:MAG TPA: YheU family protein [Syntrophorhabdus sp.]|nr:YheU family protein [Syntrophorhabdus sp.]